ncbi:MAG TPA: response regulator [Verrucomicrobiae bacterium]|jgi:HD-like signal output (HDOD) protein
MKKKILFVDDESMVLDGLRRMLRSMRTEWDMEFVASGEAALRLLAEKPFDVIVSDMRMPAMNGAELLAEVMKRHPTTIRLILSGYADKDLILKCVGSTHQYLSKPCDAESLKSAITRASDLDSSLQSSKLRSLVCRMSRLPSIPTLYTQVVEKVSEADASLEEVGNLIGKDISMTVQVLKLSNSAFFGLRRQLSTAQEAVAYLGMDTIKALVLSIHAFSQFDKAETGSLRIDTLWNHSLAVASFARRIAKLESQEAKMADESFTAGVLHDLGKLILAVNAPNDYVEANRLANMGVELTIAEEKVFGANHADVGGYLIGLWGLPTPVVEAVALHHNPSKATHHAFSPLTSVHAANILELEHSKPNSNAAAPQLDNNYLSLVGCGGRVAGWRNLVTENAKSYESANTVCR